MFLLFQQKGMTTKFVSLKKIVLLHKYQTNYFVGSCFAVMNNVLCATGAQTRFFATVNSSAM